MSPLRFAGRVRSPRRIRRLDCVLVRQSGRQAGSVIENTDTKQGREEREAATTRKEEEGRKGRKGETNT